MEKITKKIIFTGLMIGIFSTILATIESGVFSTYFPLITIAITIFFTFFCTKKISIESGQKKNKIFYKILGVMIITYILISPIIFGIIVVVFYNP